MSTPDDPRTTSVSRQNIERLFDRGSFVELDGLACDGSQNAAPGVRSGHGRVHGQTVFAFAHEPSDEQDGALSRSGAAKILRVIERATRAGAPVVGLYSARGVRHEEGLSALSAMTNVLAAMARASGAILQVAVVLGPCAGAVALAPPLADLVVMSCRGALLAPEPEVLRSLLGPSFSVESLGGAEVHAERTGLAHLLADDDDHAIELARASLSVLARGPDSEVAADVPERPLASDPVMASLAAQPETAEAPRDVRAVIDALVDPGPWIELRERYAPNVVTALARVGGRPVGVLAHQRAALAGGLDSAACAKAEDLVRLCDRAGIALVTLVDCAGLLPDSEPSLGGGEARFAGLARAFSRSRVGRVTVVIGRAYGGAYAAMGARALGVDACFAWPQAEIVASSASSFVNAVHKETLARSSDAAGDRARLVREFCAERVNPKEAAALGLVDALIEPGETRARVIEALALYHRAKR
jgi:acetyl-CoA carboxylase carboxyltransferase component